MERLQIRIELAELCSRFVFQLDMCGCRDIVLSRASEPAEGLGLGWTQQSDREAKMLWWQRGTLVVLFVRVQQLNQSLLEVQKMLQMSYAQEKALV
eukprot:Skav202083  [mRNA]  locus=scaffold513:41986:43071:- [translate_table: standard]